MTDESPTGLEGIRWRLALYLRGRRYGYPVCCSLRFALGANLGAPGAWRTRGHRYLRSGEAFIPCGIFHRAHRTGPEIERAPW